VVVLLVVWLCGLVPVGDLLCDYVACCLVGWFCVCFDGVLGGLEALGSLCGCVTYCVVCWLSVCFDWSFGGLLACGVV